MPRSTRLSPGVKRGAMQKAQTATPKGFSSIRKSFSTAAGVLKCTAVREYKT